MKFLKPFKLFEAEGYMEPEDITEDQVMLIFNDPERAPFFFSPEGDEKDRRSVNKFLSILDNMEEEITPLQFINLTKYVVRLDDFNLANGIITALLQMKHYLFSPEYLRKTLYFDEYYHPNELDDILELKRDTGMMEPDEDWIDIRAEIAAIEGGGSGRSEILSGRDLQDAIDNALDRRDFKEVERLSKMIPECYGFSFTKKISLFS